MGRSNLATLDQPRTECSECGRYLGPARVEAILAGAVEVQLETGDVLIAELALATPYAPAIGDRVLVTGERGRGWVIGVIAGTGTTVFAFDGDVELRSTRGVVRIASGKRVEIDSPEVGLEANTLRVLANSLVENVASFTQRVRGILSVHAGQRREVIDGATSTQAKTSTLLTEGDVKVNGKAIHLG